MVPVAQPAAEMAARYSSGEESAPEISPEPAEQEQVAPSMEAMMQLLLQKVDGVQNAVDRVSVRTTALESAVADVSQSGSEVDLTGRGSASAATMVAASPDRRERILIRTQDRGHLTTGAVVATRRQRSVRRLRCRGRSDSGGANSSGDGQRRRDGSSSRGGGSANGLGARSHGRDDT